MSEKQGPCVRRLICQKMSCDAVPSGGGLGDAVAFLKDKDKIISGARAATAWVKMSIEAVRLASEPNPWKEADDEVIAAEILRQMEARHVK